MDKLTQIEQIKIEKKIAALESSLSGDLLLDLEVKNEIHQLTMVLEGISFKVTEEECVGCGC